MKSEKINKSEGFWPTLLGIYLIEIFGMFVTYFGCTGLIGNNILSYFECNVMQYAIAINIVVGVGGFTIMILAGVGIAKIIAIKLSD